VTKIPLAWTGLLLFAVTLMLLEWWGTGRVTWLAVRMLLVAAAGYTLFRLLPWAAVLRRLPPQSWGFQHALYFVFLAHFVRVLLQETTRLFVAWRLSAPRTFGPGGFVSLARATASLFPRCMARAERFHASLLLREEAH
jgi:hypothetical protein